MIRRRNEFSAQTKREAFERSRGICECHLIPHVFKTPCGLPLGQGNTFYEHIDPDKISGRNDLANAAVLTKTCWRHKTRIYDLPTVADNNRMQDRARGIRRIVDRPLVGTIGSGWKHKMAGGWERR